MATTLQCVNVVNTIKTMAQQLGISESTEPYPNDGCYRHVYVNCLAGVVERHTKKVLIEPHEFEVMLWPEQNEMDDDKMLEANATYKAKYRYLNKMDITNRLKEMGITTDWYIDLIILWQYSIPINKLVKHGINNASEFY